MKIVYADHQHNSIATELERQGHLIVCPPVVGSDFDFDLTVLKNSIDFNRPDCVIGAARGASLVMAANPSQPIILLAPNHKQDKTGLKKFATVIHGVLDDMIPVEDSLELENIHLYLVQDNHWLREQGTKTLLGVVRELQKSGLQNAIP